MRKAIKCWCCDKTFTINEKQVLIQYKDWLEEAGCMDGKKHRTCEECANSKDYCCMFVGNKRNDN